MTRQTVGTAGAAVEVHDVPEHLSYSQLTMLHPAYRYACARKWAYRYRLKLQDELSAALLVGRAWDEAANTFWRLRVQGAPVLDSSTAAAAVGQRTLIGYLADQPELFQTKAAGEDPAATWEGMLLAAWFEFVRVEGEREAALVQDKHTFTIRLDANHVVPVVGYSDRIDVDGTLVDHKFSGSPRWSKDDIWHEEWVAERRDQLLLYWLARQAEERRTGKTLTPPINGKARLVVTYHKVDLVKPQVRALDIDLDLTAGQELLERLATAGRTAQAGRYPARPGPACSFCSYRSRCRDDEEARGRPFFELIDIPF